MSPFALVDRPKYEVLAEISGNKSRDVEAER